MKCMLFKSFEIWSVLFKIRPTYLVTACNTSLELKFEVLGAELL